MSKYHSKYCKNKQITAAQYITEIICENIAAKEGRQLALQFWQNEEWKKIFKYQLGLAYGLLKKYSASAIIKALRTYKGKTAYSLKADFILKPLMKKFEAEEKLKDGETKVKPMNTKAQPRTRKNKKSILEMLDE